MEQDEDEMLQGVDWTVVKDQLDMRVKMDHHLPDVNPSIDWMSWWKGLVRLWGCCMRCCGGKETMLERMEKAQHKEGAKQDKAADARVRADIAAAVAYEKVCVCVVCGCVGVPS